MIATITVKTASKTTVKSNTTVPFNIENITKHKNVKMIPEKIALTNNPFGLFFLTQSNTKKIEIALIASLT